VRNVPVGGRVEFRYPVHGGGLEHYALWCRDSVQATLPTGETQIQLFGRTAHLTLSWVGVDSGAQITAVVDSLIPDSGQISFGAILDSARGSRWTAFRDPSGRLRGIAGGSGSVVSDQVRDQLLMLFPVIPADGAVPGGTWTDSLRLPARLSAFRATESVRQASRAGQAPDGSLSIATVRLRVAADTGTQFGQPINLRATGSDTLTYRVDPAGRVLEVTGVQATDLVVELPSIGQSVPAQERSTLRITLLP
jgi:hypothetical protein